MDENKFTESTYIGELKQSGYKIIQDKDAFCFGIDAVLLSDFAKVKNNQTVVDLGTGTGIIPLLLAHSINAKKIYGLEIQEKSFNMASESVKLNNLEEKIQIVCGDIKYIERSFSPRIAEVVISNPPYMINEHGKQNKNDEKTIARHEVLCNLEDVIKAASFLLKPCGSFFMIHKPFRLSEIFVLCNKYKLEPKRMQLILPFEGEEPTMVLIEARKDAKPRITIEKSLVVYEKPGIYTDEINKIYGY